MPANRAANPTATNTYWVNWLGFASGNTTPPTGSGGLGATIVKVRLAIPMLPCESVALKVISCVPRDNWTEKAPPRP